MTLGFDRACAGTTYANPFRSASRNVALWSAANECLNRVSRIVFSLRIRHASFYFPFFGDGDPMRRRSDIYSSSSGTKKVCSFPSPFLLRNICLFIRQGNGMRRERGITLLSPLIHRFGRRNKKFILECNRTRHTNKDMISPTLKHHKPPRNKEKLQTHLQDLARETVERFGLLLPSTIQTCLQWEGQINEQIDQSKCWCRKWLEEESQSRPTHHLMIPLCVPLPCAVE